MLKRLFLICALALSACDGEEAAPTAETLDGQKPVIEKLADGVWMHTSHYEFPGGAKVPSNGLAVADGEGLILIDTAWGELATKNLVEDLETQTGLPVTKAVITHFHYDRLAGVDWLEDRGVTIFTHPDTPAKSAALGTPVPNTSVAALQEPRSRTLIGPVEVAYPGPGHTPDNLVAYVKGANILFGGCAVRAAHHSSMGNTADANLIEWGPGIAWVKSVYKDAEIVVPSHGTPGNAKLLDHTLALLAKTEQSAEPAPEP